jgi:hypothetical protein
MRERHDMRETREKLLVDLLENVEFVRIVRIV